MEIKAETFTDLIFHIILVQNSKYKNHHQKNKDQDNINIGFSRYIEGQPEFESKDLPSPDEYKNDSYHNV